MKKFSPLKYLLSVTLLSAFLIGAGGFSTARAAADSKEAAAENESEAQRLAGVWSRETFRRAGELYAETAEDWRRLDEPLKAADCWREAAKIAQITSDYETAFKALENSLTISEKARDADGVIIALSLLSLVSRQKGNIRESENYYKRAMGLSANSTSNAARAYAAFSAGMYNFYYGDLKQTTFFFEEANSFAEKTVDISLISQVLFYKGFSSGREGNPFIGLAQMEKALQKCRDAGYLRGQALALFGIGFMAMLTDEKQKALDAYREAEKLFPTDFEWLERAKLYNSIAAIYADYGASDVEEIYRIQALDFYRKADYPFGELAALPSLAKLKYLKGERDAGKKLYDEATVLARRLQNDFYIAVINEDLGDFSLKDGLSDEAIAYYNKAKIGYRDSKINLPRIENQSGAAFQQKGDFAAARRLYESALKDNLEIKDMLSAAENLSNLSQIDLAQGDSESARGRLSESLRISEDLFNNVTNNKLRGKYLANTSERYERYISLLMKLHARAPAEKDFAAQALQTAEKARTRMMLENLALSEANFTKDADAETIRREREIRVLLNIKADSLTDSLSGGADKSETDRLSREISALENELEEIRARLKQQSPIYSAIKNPAPFDVEDFQRNVLDDDSLLLEFSFGRDESYLWTVEKNEVQAYVLPPRAELESNIEALLDLLKERGIKPDESLEDYQLRISDAEKNYRAQASELSRVLFGQIAEKMGKKRLIVVPDGKLHYLPIAALPQPDSADAEPILLNNETVYEPSAQTLAVLTKNRRQTAPAEKNLLVFSDPIFSDADARFSPGSKPAAAVEEAAKTEQFRYVESLNNLGRLAASRDESETIIETIGAGGAENYSGFQATRDNLLNLKTNEYKILHFATHGYISEERPELSGIVLSRFDEKGQPLNQFFRIQDIYALSLNADLVVLSACQTGVGKELKGEGLLSLNNAFLQTGAKSVVASLWKVEDNATLELMKDFYGALANEHLTPSQSLRRAQLRLRENPQFRSPFYWAAFTMQGDFRNVPNLSRRSDSWLYLLSVLPLSFAGFYFYKRRKRNSEPYSTAKP